MNRKYKAGILTAILLYTTGCANTMTMGVGPTMNEWWNRQPASRFVHADVEDGVYFSTQKKKKHPKPIADYRRRYVHNPYFAKPQIRE